MISRTTIPPLRFRVLIVDNEETPRDLNAFTVSDLHLEPIVAVGKYDALLKDALTQAQQKRCHLALVDMRLLNDKDPNDKSGLELISALPKHMFSMVVSGSDDGRDRTNATTLDEAHSVGAAGYAGYVKKPHSETEDNRVQKGDKELSTTILEVIQRHWNWSLTYDFARAGSSPDRILARLGLSDTNEVPPDEVHNLLRRSYNHRENALSLESIEEPYELSDSAPSFRRSVVFFVDAYDKDGETIRHEIIKFAPRDHVDREYENYRNYVRRLQHQFTALIEEEPVVTWDIGLIRYTDETVGERMRFTEWYRNSDNEHIKEAILHIFGTVLSPWYDPNRDQEGAKKRNDSVYDHYTSPNSFRKLSSQMETFSHNESIRIATLPDTFLNPVLWAMKHREQSRFKSRWGTLIHGDLHSDNIIVDNDNRTYLIDYERTGRGYYLRDFIELEKDIRLRLLRLDSDQIALAAHLDCLLFGQEAPDLLPDWRDPDHAVFSESSRKELNKAFQAICAIRQAAADFGGLLRLDEYYWALLMETLLTVTDPRVTGVAFQRALLSASLICERLERWRNTEKGWPPEDRCADLTIIGSTTKTSVASVAKDVTTSKSKESKSHNGEVSVLRDIVILHLSDIHLGTTPQAEVYYSQLETDLLHGVERKQLDYLVLNGDMADRATVSDYEAAQLLIDRIVKRFRLKRSAIIIVPGNHDVDYSSSKPAYGRFAFDPILAEDSGKRSIKQPEGQILCDDEHVYQRRFANFAHFFQAIRKKPYPLLSSEQALIWQFPNHKLLFLGLNSAVEIDHHYEKRAIIDRLALASVLQQLTGKYDDWLKIAVWHHPVQGSEAMNAEFIEQLTMRGFQICMHGHIHEAIEDYHKYDDRRGVRVIGAGTFGAPVRQQTVGIPLQYNLITLNPMLCTVQVDTRKKEKPDGAWSADARWVDKVRDPQPRYSFDVKWGLCATHGIV